MGEAAAAKPAKGWLRLLIESVDVPLDQKDPHRLLFSTVQSLIPGAHGLYYRGADGARKALSFDGYGHVNSPDEGWDEQNIFVHLAHGHRAGVFGCGGVVRGASSSGDVSETTSPPSSPLDAYTSATDRFEKTVSLVQKMMTASSIGHRSPRKTSRAVASQDSTSEEDTISKRYKEENEGLRKKVTELESALASANETIEDAKESQNREIHHLRESSACTEARLDEAERMAESATRRACEADHACESERLRADKAEWSLGEHRAWLAESNARVTHLEGQLEEAQSERADQQARADKAEWTLGEHVAWLEQAKIRNDQLERSLSGAKEQIDELRNRAERAEWNFEEQAVRLAEEREKNRIITAAADSATTELREKVASIESELCHRAAPIIPPEHAEADTTVASSNASEDEEKEEEIEEEIQLVSVSHQEAAPPVKDDTVEQLESRVLLLESALEESRRAVEAEFEARLADVSRRADESLAEVVAAKKRLEEESAAEVITKIQELTEKEDELNNLHSVIEDLREKLKSLERARADAEWHLGEHRDWLKNERDKVAYLEEQLRRVSAGEATTSRPVSRKNSTESGFGGSTSATAAGDDSGGERRGGSESPPAPAMLQSSAMRKMKFTATSSDDLATELMALSKDKQRMAAEIRELKARPDPNILEAERRMFAENIQASNERCARLEAETAHYKDVAARVNMDAFNAKDGKIAELEKIRSNLEWSLGEKTQEINDAKWRIGELEGQCALQKLTPLNAEAVEEKDRDLRHLRDERAHLVQQLENARWRIGELEAECSRLHHSHSSERAELERLRKEWNDQKWRIGELESGYAHHEWLLSQAPSLDEVKALRSEKFSLEQRLGEAWRAANDAKWRLGELEAELSSLRQRASDAPELHQLREERDRLQREWHDQQWRIGELESGYAHHEWVIDELRKKERREDGSSLHERELEWKLGEAHKETENLRGRIGHLEWELGRRDAAAAAERPGQLEESLRGLRTEKETLEQRVRELDQMFNDTKWRNGELEAGLAHTKWLLEQERMTVARMEDCNSDVTRDGSFVVRHRRPGDSRLWQLAMKTSKDDTSELRAVTLTIDEPRDTDAVFLIGSFSTWECCARLTRPNPSSGKRELTVHLPRGRHEFRFIVDGGWANSSSYPTVPNPYGTSNNWITVE